MYSLFKKPILITFLFDEIKKYFLFTCKIVGCNYIFFFSIFKKKDWTARSSGGQKSWFLENNEEFLDISFRNFFMIWFFNASWNLIFKKNFVLWKSIFLND